MRRAMNLDDITLNLVTKALKNWHQHKSTPKIWLQLDYLQNKGGSDEEKLQWFYKDVYNFALKQLTQARNLCNLPIAPATTQDEYNEAIRSDFSAKSSKNVEVWSALYYRYLEPFVRSDVKMLGKLGYFNSMTFYRRAKEGAEYLRKYIWELEYEAHKSMKMSSHIENLPEPEYKKLIDSSSTPHNLRNLLSKGESCILSIEGLGGIGKTAHAHQLSEWFLKEYETDGAIWISARQEWLDQNGILVKSTGDLTKTRNDILRKIANKLMLGDYAQYKADDLTQQLIKIFTSRPYLLIVDNLETVTDRKALIPTLRMFCNPTRIIVTSRLTLRSYAYVNSILVPELKYKDASKLINTELQRISSGFSLEESDFEQIYETIGGIPLALKLTAAQLHTKGGQEVIRGLKKSKTRSRTTLFNYIYAETWKLLSPNAQKVLLCLYDIDPEGATVDWIYQTCQLGGLNSEEIELGLNELMVHALVEISHAGIIENELMYKLHRLTITFLQDKLK